jgi:hypothetical protein
MKNIIRILSKPATSDICTPQVYGVWCKCMVHGVYTGRIQPGVFPAVFLYRFFGS